MTSAREVGFDVSTCRFDSGGPAWEVPIISMTMHATVTDDRRRLVMPPELPARSAVTIQQLDGETWLVKRQIPDRQIVMVAFHNVERLPDDPQWEAMEEKIARHTSRHVPPLEA